MVDFKVCVIFLILGVAIQLGNGKQEESGGCEDTFDVFHNVRPKGITGDVWKKGTSLKKCLAACFNNEDCEAFDYRKTASKKKKCVLYFDPEVHEATFRPVRKEDHYTRVRCQATTQWPTTMPPTTLPPTTMPPTTLPPTTLPPTTLPPTTLPPTTMPPTTMPPTTLVPTTMPPTTTEGACGDYFVELSGEFTSPDYPDEYRGNVYCVWVIAMSDDQRVWLSFDSFQLEEHFDYVTVYDGEEEVASYTGYDIPSPVLSSSNSLTVVMTTDDGTNYPGFSASYECADSFELYKANSRPKKTKGIRYKVVNNLEDCMLACLARSNCKSFDFRANKGKGQKCYVYTKNVTAFKKAKKENHYRRVRAC